MNAHPLGTNLPITETMAEACRREISRIYASIHKKKSVALHRIY